MGCAKYAFFKVFYSASGRTLSYSVNKCRKLIGIFSPKKLDICIGAEKSYGVWPIDSICHLPYSAFSDLSSFRLPRVSWVIGMDSEVGRDRDIRCLNARIA